MLKEKRENLIFGRTFFSNRIVKEWNTVPADIKKKNKVLGQFFKAALRKWQLADERGIAKRPP
jgi:hypothetical protein